MLDVSIVHEDNKYDRQQRGHMHDARTSSAHYRHSLNDVPQKKFSHFQSELHTSTLSGVCSRV